MGAAIEGWWATRSDRNAGFDRVHPDIAHGGSCARPPKVIFAWPVTRTDS